MTELKDMRFGPGGWELRVVGQNRTEVRTPKGLVCFSYSTPVVVYVNSSKKLFMTSEFVSKTTSRHMAHWNTGTFDKFERINSLVLEVIVRDVLGIREDT